MNHFFQEIPKMFLAKLGRSMWWIIAIEKQEFGFCIQAGVNLLLKSK